MPTRVAWEIDYSDAESEPEEWDADPPCTDGGCAPCDDREHCVWHIHRESDLALLSRGLGDSRGRRFMARRMREDSIDDEALGFMVSGLAKVCIHAVAVEGGTRVVDALQQNRDDLVNALVDVVLRCGSDDARHWAAHTPCHNALALQGILPLTCAVMGASGKIGPGGWALRQRTPQLIGAMYAARRHWRDLGQAPMAILRFVQLMTAAFTADGRKIAAANECPLVVPLVLEAFTSTHITRHHNATASDLLYGLDVIDGAPRDPVARFRSVSALDDMTLFRRVVQSLPHRLETFQVGPDYHARHKTLESILLYLSRRSNERGHPAHDLIIEAGVVQAVARMLAVHGTAKEYIVAVGVLLWNKFSGSLSVDDQIAGIEAGVVELLIAYTVATNAEDTSVCVVDPPRADGRAPDLTSSLWMQPIYLKRLASNATVGAAIRSRAAPLSAPLFRRAYTFRSKRPAPSVGGRHEGLLKEWRDLYVALGLAVPEQGAIVCSWAGCTRDLVGEAVKLKTCAACQTVVRRRCWALI